ncbi:tautomerase family protein [Lysobacter cavernae]|uniref:Tautomerase family protein n=1 Tax=Lysobacter cavernae TaxID=1685901 RepID=A0ABV7RK15_9GAMM
MAQIKIYGLAQTLDPIRAGLSDTIHSCLVDIFRLPVDKRFHRFFRLQREDFVFPGDRSAHYLIVEISCFEGRSAAAKKALIGALFERIKRNHGIASHDVEITITETPRWNWGIRGVSGDELGIDYRVCI